MDVHKLQVLIQSQFEKAGIKSAQEETQRLLKQAKDVSKLKVNPKFETKEVKKLRSEIDAFEKQLEKNNAKIAKLANVEVPTSGWEKLTNETDRASAELEKARKRAASFEAQLSKTNRAALEAKLSQATDAMDEGFTKYQMAYANRATNYKPTVGLSGDDLARAKAYNKALEQSVQDATGEYNKLRIAKERAEGDLDNHEALLAKLDLEKMKVKELENEYAQLSAKKSAFNGAKYEASPDLGRLQGINDDIQERLGDRRARLDNLLSAEQAKEAQANGSRLYQTIGRIRSAINRLIPSLTKGKRGFTDFSRGMRSTYGTGGALSRMLRTIAISFRFMVASMLIRGAFNSVTQGFTDLYNYGGRTAQTLLTLKNALAGLRGSFAAAFAPIINFVGPALNYLINMLTSAMNAIARFFAVLTGQKTYEKASFGTSGFEAAGGAADGANKKAKEYQRTLLGFDKINKLNDEPSSSGGGGGGGGGGTATEATWSEAIAKSPFAEMVKKAWANDADFTEVGRYVGQKLEEALDKIPWERIKEKAYKIGKATATFLNGFNEPSTWKAIGKTIAEGLNTALELAYGFIHNFKFGKFGKALAQGFNKMIKTINWKKVGKALTEGIKGAFSFLSQAIRNLDYVAIGDALREVVAGAVKGAIESIPDIIKALPSLLFGLIEIGADIVLGIAQGIGEAMADVATWLWNKLVSPLIEAIKSLFGIASPATTMVPIGENLILGIIEGLGNKLSDLVGWFKKLPQTITKLVKGIKMKLNIAISLVKKGWTTLVKFVGDKITAAVSLAKKGWSTLKQWVGDKVAVGISLVKKGWSTISKFVGTAVKVSISLVKHGWTAIKSWLGINKALVVSLKLPRVGVSWGSKTVAGFKISYPNGFYTYARGGFPEEGPFMMNRGEIAGRFGNGKGVVANNQQITEAFASAIGSMMYNAVVSGMKQSGGKDVTVVLEGDSKKLFKVVQKEANQYQQTTGQFAFDF